MWKIFTEAVEGKPAFVEQCIEKLSEAVTELIQSDSNNLEGVSAFQHLTSLIYRFTHLQTDKVDVLKRIVLKEVNFEQLETNPLPLKMFRDLFLDGSINFDISQLMQERDADRDGKFSYDWLLSSMLNFKYLVSLTNFLELKNQLIIFVESDVIPALIIGDKAFIVSLCETIASKATASDAANVIAAGSYQLTLQYFIAKMVDPGEDFPADMKPVLRIDDFREIFTKVSLQTA